ncbi:DUF305 domain-containing protein [Deinococcus psychrotolerans]|uniref:DUF305 domain-containing protein n=1 Tax=Deinococcus psychrotolerans TaxID=2489213 RepID=A0A3G8YP65_9DEIO|nr:DUF305 domain-containing protein [Deinococcus psychrotolerans]AZI42946.1 DUF305 domain-containing protein [Deinococcus psychrotolerans]
MMTKRNRGYTIKRLWLAGLLLMAGAGASMPGMKMDKAQASQSPASHSSPASGMASDTLGHLKALKGRAFDVAFAQAMTQHHQMALDMAALELAEGTRQTVKAAAKAVIAGQTKEIGQMKAWLSTWKAAAPSGKMALTQPKAGQVDRWFLTEMLPHHRGAVEMSRVALKNSQSAEVKTLARQIIAAQNKEISQYQTWLGALK